MISGEIADLAPINRIGARKDTVGYMHALSGLVRQRAVRVGAFSAGPPDLTAEGKRWAASLWRRIHGRAWAADVRTTALKIARPGGGHREAVISMLFLSACGNASRKTAPTCRLSSAEVWRLIGSREQVVESSMETTPDPGGIRVSQDNIHERDNAVLWICL